MEAVNGCVKGLSNFVSASDTVGESGDLVNEHSTIMEIFKGSVFSQRLSKALHFHSGFQRLCTTIEVFKGCALSEVFKIVHYHRGFQRL